VQAVLVEFVDLSAVGADRFELQILTIDFVADSIHAVAYLVVDARDNLEILPEAFPLVRRGSGF
jgi:hypothetical protein